MKLYLITGIDCCLKVIVLDLKGKFLLYLKRDKWVLLDAKSTLLNFSQNLFVRFFEIVPDDRN